MTERLFDDYIEDMTTTIDDIQGDFALLDDWEERYRYIIDLGGDLASYPESARDGAHKVPGCVSQVWLLTERGEGEDPVLRFSAIRTLISCAGSSPSCWRSIPAGTPAKSSPIDAEAALRRLGLDEHLTPQRANGLRAMIKRIRLEAGTALSPARQTG